MPFYKVKWPSEDFSPHWGRHTDWVIRAPNAETALAIAYENETNARDLVVKEVPLEGSTEIILWYGPDA